MKILRVAAILLAFAGSALAQSYPAKPVKLIVPFPPGGNTDTLARLIAQPLSAALGTPVVIDNKPGAGGSVGSALAARAPADGYTILGGTISSHAINRNRVGIGGSTKGCPSRDGQNHLATSSRCRNNLTKDYIASQNTSGVLNALPKRLRCRPGRYWCS